MPDGALVNDLILREHLVREIRTFRPDAVLATDPTVIFYRFGGVNHTDHREAGLAAVDAVYPAARNPMAFPTLARSGLEAHRVRRLYLFWPNEPNVRVDISSTLDRKIAALAAHASQIREPEQLAERIRSWAAEEGEPIGAAAGEALRLVVIDDDEDEGPDRGLATQAGDADAGTTDAAAAEAVPAGSAKEARPPEA
jgi:LmbE family N-acetylglucosaminyl deacetylase